MRKNIFKKLALLSTFVMTSACISGYTPVSGSGHPDEWDIDNSQFVYDYADVFSDSEELELQEMCEEVGKELELDVVVVSARDLGGMHEKDYADDFYDFGGYSESGILYLVDLYHDGIWVSTAGMAMVYIDDYDVETILDAIWVEYEDYNYYESAEVFVETVNKIVEPRKNDGDFEELEEAWKEGGYDDYNDFWMDYEDDITNAYKENFFTDLRDNPLLCMAIAAVFAFIVVLIMSLSSNAKMTAGSKTYMKSGSFKLLQKYDKFTHTTTTTHKVSSSSSGGGGSRGRSSSHRSSSGRSHGGGGRRR